ncbi:hypothetical protein IMSHALPRED_005180 [Imshaugia aleurites]|uniref:Uncharacterized protein n=1 Tax=Imshaugia aleurites TaxID=172621 RepID=A0A8H3IB08_9LECA|nr:hypothetical protein IMSHALPRED_005180 [Imshaugia aleurites]
MPPPIPISAEDSAAYQLEAKFKHLKFQPPCSCSSCLHQYRSPDLLGKLFNYDGHLKPEEVEQLVRSHKRSIDQDRLFIHAALSLYGDTILKKWRRDRSTRDKLLRQVYPEIPLLDTPGVYIAMNGKSAAEDRPKLRQIFLLPYITLEALVEDASRMIGLLVHRATTSLEDWIAFDDIEVQEGWKYGVLTEKSALGCIDLHGANFGILKPFNADRVHRRISYGAPRALLILDAQRHLFGFLRQTVTNIINDESRVREIATVLDASHLGIGDKVARFLSNRQMRHSRRPVFGSVYSEKPFDTPPIFDIDELVSIASDRVAEKQDDIWLLQTDLAYVQECANYHEKIESKANNIGYMISLRAVLQARDWKWIHDECQNVKEEAKKAGVFKKTVVDASPRYERALGYLLLLLEQELKDTQHSLERVMWKSPAFQTHFHFQVFNIENIPLRHRMKILLNDPQNLYHRDRLAWCLFMLTIEPTTNLNLPPNAVNLGNDHHIVLQHLDSYLSSQPHKESQRIDSEMYGILTDLTALERMIDLLNLHRPKFQSLKPEDMPKRHAVWLARVELPADTVLMAADEMDLGPAYTRLLESFPNGRKDEIWLTQRDKAHKMLSLLWAQARDKYQIMLTRVSVPMPFIEPELYAMQQCDCDALKQQLQREKAEIMEHLETVRGDTSGRDLEANLHLHDENSSVAKPSVDTKIKAKTRPEKTLAEKEPSMLQDPKDVDMEYPTILYNLDKSSIAWTVLPLLFPTATDTDTNGTGKTPIAWSEFVQTMRELGFHGSHRGGSVVTFRGDIFVSGELGPRKRSINVHKPHPSTELGLVLVQTIGRRFNRRFGWSLACFRMA